jgi:hypothetical protein
MKNVRRIISCEVQHLDSIYAGKKYDKITKIVYDKLRSHIESEMIIPVPLLLLQDILKRQKL